MCSVAGCAQVERKKRCPDELFFCKKHMKLRNSITAQPQCFPDENKEKDSDAKKISDILSEAGLPEVNCSSVDEAFEKLRAWGEQNKESAK
jgi:hypothetical protein